MGDSKDSSKFSRRAFFKRLLFQEPSEPEEAPPEDCRDEHVFAVIQGKFCLAYEGEPCTRCFDICPENGAIELHEGIPMINTDLCTGCWDCKGSCPAEADAILMVPRSH